MQPAAAKRREAGRPGKGEGEAEMERVWKALANPTRRRMLDVLYQGPRTTGELVELFPDLSRFAVMQHLRVLEDAELVIARRAGRRRYNHLNPVPIQQVYDRWVSRYMKPWTESLVGLRHQLETETQDESA
jgi:DNA-binding transcriptional ArsR family regulator